MTQVTVDIPEGVRAVLVHIDHEGVVQARPAPAEKAFLNIRKDLISHISDQPYSVEWLTNLRDYLNDRLEVEASAKSGGYLIQTTGGGRNFVRAELKPVDAETLALVQGGRPC